MRLKKILIVLLAITSFRTFSKIDSTQTNYHFSLVEAQEYALKHNKSIKQSFIETLKADEKVWETLAMGLPQVDAKIDYSYMLEVPDAVKSFSSFSQLPHFMYNVSSTLNKLTNTWGADQFQKGSKPAATQATSEDDMKWSSDVSITVSQLIFSGSYIVGVKASKVYDQLIKLNHENDKQNLIENLTNSYILVLIANENNTILNNLYNNTEKLYKETQAIYKEGLVEDTEIDQLELVLKNIDNTRNAVARQLSLAYYLLKYQLGIDLTDYIELKDDLSSILSSWDLNSIILKQFELDKNINYQLLKTNVALQDLNHDLAKSEFLPTIGAFYRYYKNLNDNSFNLNPSNVVGVSMNINLFSSGKKWSKVNQAKYDLEIAQLKEYEKSEALKLDFKQTKISYTSAYDKFINQKQNMELAKRIYEKTMTKYKEGVSSSLDLAQVQNQYLESQTNYYSSVSEMLQLKTKLEKILKESSIKTEN